MGPGGPGGFGPGGGPGGFGPGGPGGFGPGGPGGFGPLEVPVASGPLDSDRVSGDLVSLVVASMESLICSVLACPACAAVGCWKPALVDVDHMAPLVALHSKAPTIQAAITVMSSRYLYQL
ncbi:hypothetical protein Dimus_016075 [Dionaea muscipula]